MMSVRGRAMGACCILGSLSLSGCAIPPDIQDSTGLDTYEVVRRIRCEMRDGIRSLVKNAVAYRDPAYAAEHLNTDKDFLSLDKSTIPEAAKEVLEQYEDTLVGYEFTFDITENNDANVGVNVLHTFTRGTFGIRFGATNNRERNNIENFRIIDSFSKLVLRVGDDYCKIGSVSSHPANYMYPITGKLNLHRYAKKFLDLNQSGNLAPDENTVSKSVVSAFTITLKFTTTLVGSVKPNLSLPTKGKRWEITGVDGELGATRKDVHSVAVVFALPTEGDKRSLTIAEERVLDELDNVRDREDIQSLRRRLDEF